MDFFNNTMDKVIGPTAERKNLNLKIKQNFSKHGNRSSPCYILFKNWA